LYTRHEEFMRKWMYPVAGLMLFDSVSLFLNLFFGHQFLVSKSSFSFGDFYLTTFRTHYYIHLMIDYALVILTLAFMIYRIVRSYSIYRTRYVIILSFIVVVIILNILYMAFGLVLDASVIFYAVSGILIYFGITRFVPRSLKAVAVERAIDDMSEGIMLFELDGSCIHANAFMRTRFGIDPGHYDLTMEPASSFMAQLSEFGLDFGHFSYSRPAKISEDREKEYYNIRYNKLSDKKGRPIGSYFLVEDTTENEYLLQELKEARITAELANRAKSDFLASMSHEIRTPLNAVLGMNELILRTSDDPQITEYANNIMSSGDALLSLINDILDFSKIEAHKMEIISTDYRIHDILRDCFGFFIRLAEEKDLYFRINCAKNIPSVLTGDGRHIKQILANLISNAIKYTSEGGVAVDVSTKDQKAYTTSVVFSVTDTGMGIEDKDIASLFDAFKRIDEQKNATIQGTGLGLAITKDLVGLMNGTIEVSSTPGKGSTFTVTIPQLIGDPTPAGSFVTQSKTGQKEYRESFRAEGAKILVVDDVKLNLDLTEALLKKTGIAIDTASSGTEAIGLCRSNKYDAILLDHRMPEPDGVATFAVISKEGLNTDTPVIMLTANALAGVEKEYLDMGFTDYLSKPVKGEDLERVLVSHLPSEKVVLIRNE
ncbi:MAG: response regulator, partial [Lachnospiraceae bacterium]|nr:response regulator [Lachnospiraceae bacterium]